MVCPWYHAVHKKESLGLFGADDSGLQKYVKLYNEGESLMITPDPKNTEFWHDYYKQAENSASGQFDKIIKPIILDKYSNISFAHVMDFACGFGRMSNIFKRYANRITCCDINSLAIEHCKERFESNRGDTDSCQFSFCVSDSSLTLPFDDRTFSFIFSWDAMVHFKYKWCDYYLHEFSRILLDGAYALIHHSNYGNVQPDLDKSENWNDNPSGRSNVSADDIVFMAQKHGLTVVEQNIFNWGGVPKLDCISLLRKKPQDAAD